MGVLLNVSSENVNVRKSQSECVIVLLSSRFA